MEVMEILPQTSSIPISIPMRRRGIAMRKVSFINQTLCGKIIFELTKK